MRLALLVLAVLGCHHAPPPAPPANQAPAPDFTATANDVLGFLPAETDLVLGVDMAALRHSAMWQQFQPQVQAIGQEFAKLGGQCGPNPIDTLERFAMAVKVQNDGAVQGVIVARGVDTTRVLDCIVAQSNKNGGTAKLDRGVAVVTYPDRPNVQMAAATVGPSTLVVQLDATANADTIAAVLASGTPLRKSTSFMTLFQRREPGAAVWGMANGNAPMFEQLAQMNMRPRSLDGTLSVTDRFTFAVRMTMATPEDAAHIVSELDQIKGPASSMVERFETRADGPTAVVTVAITVPQLRTLLGMLGVAAP